MVTKQAQTGILLLWIRSQAEIYQRISRNIAREIYEYLRPLRPLIVLDETGIALFDVGKRRIIEHLVDLPGTSEGHFQLLYMGQRGIFLYKIQRMLQGGSRNSAFLYQINNQLTELPKSISSRMCPGPYYDPFSMSIYLFGGQFSGNSSEKLDLTSYQWADSGKMKASRSHFHPCRWKEEVYLCGGGTVSIETFNPYTGLYTLLPIQLPEMTESLAIAFEGKICVLTPFYMTKIDVNSCSLHSNKRNMSSVWSWSTPVLHESSVYLLFARLKEVVLGIGLDTGEIMMKIELMTLRIPKHGLPKDDTKTPFLVIC